MRQTIRQTVQLLRSFNAAYNTSKWLLVRHLARTQSGHRRLGRVTLQGQGLGLGLGTSLFPVGATEVKGFLPDQ